MKMYGGEMGFTKILKMDIQELPLPVKVIGRNGKSKFYMIRKSGEGAQMCGIDKPLAELLQEKFRD